VRLAIQLQDDVIVHLEPLDTDVTRVSPILVTIPAYLDDKYSYRLIGYTSLLLVCRVVASTVHFVSSSKLIPFRNHIIMA